MLNLPTVWKRKNFTPNIKLQKYYDAKLKLLKLQTPEEKITPCSISQQYSMTIHPDVEYKKIGVLDNRFIFALQFLTPDDN